MYKVYLELGGTQLVVTGEPVDEQEANRVEQAICRHFAQFPGGTQSIMVWREKQ